MGRETTNKKVHSMNPMHKRNRFLAAWALVITLTAGTLSAAAEGQPPNTTQPLEVSTYLRRLMTLDHLPLRTVSGQTCLQSTYDRKGRNAEDANDWKQLEGDRNVLLDVDGPGCVQSIFHAASHFGEGDISGSEFRVFLDHATEPAIAMPCLEYIKYPREIGPVVLGFKTGYCGSFLPIPFAKHCRIELYNSEKKNWGWFWEVTYTRYAEGTSVKTLTWPLSDAEKAIQNDVVKQWAQAETAPPESPKQWTLEKTLGLEPGASREVALSGTGVIRHMRMLASPDTAEVLGKVVMQLSWDGDKTPAVDLPLGYFFGHVATGHKDQYYSLLMGVAQEYAYCRFPMPFGKGAVIRFENRSAETVSLKFQAEVDTSVPDCGNQGRFHATLTETEVAEKFANKKELPTIGPLNVPYHTVLDLKGVRGKYVGQFMHVDWPVDFWWGEGDPLIWSDAEGWPPPYHGTGTETYFNSGWCKFGNTAVSGIIRPPRMVPGHVGVYSYHLHDAFPFENQFRFLFEIWSWCFDPLKDGPFEKIPHAFWRTTAFWYEYK